MRKPPQMPVGSGSSTPVDEAVPPRGERIAKRMARAGLCSRRDAERWIDAGRVRVNGRTLETAACVVSATDQIEVDGEPLPAIERTRLWLLHKRSGRVTTSRDPEGRATVFDDLPDTLPRVLTIGRLDINTEGLMLLTNDGGLARVLELPSTGWLRRYRVRAHGTVTQQQLDGLKDGIAVDGILYGSIDAELERQQGSNVWLTFAMREGKNREVKNVLQAIGLEVNRLIRISYGPFQLGDLVPGEVREVRGRTLRDQLGVKLVEASGANFDAPAPKSAKAKDDRTDRASGKVKTRTAAGKKKSSHKRTDPLERLQTKPPRDMKRRSGNDGRPSASKRRPARKGKPDADRRR